MGIKERLDRIRGREWALMEEIWQLDTAFLLSTVDRLALELMRLTVATNVDDRVGIIEGIDRSSDLLAELGLHIHAEREDLYARVARNAAVARGAQR